MFLKIMVISLLGINAYGDLTGTMGYEDYISKVRVCFPQESMAQEVKRLSAVPDSLINKITKIQSLDELDFINNNTDINSSIIAPHTGETVNDYYSRITERFYKVFPEIKYEYYYRPHEVWPAGRLPENIDMDKNYNLVRVNEPVVYKLSENDKLYESQNCSVVAIAKHFKLPTTRQVLQVDERIHSQLTQLQKYLLLINLNVYKKADVYAENGNRDQLIRNIIALLTTSGSTTSQEFYSKLKSYRLLSISRTYHGISYEKSLEGFKNEVVTPFIKAYFEENLKSRLGEIWDWRISSFNFKVTEYCPDMNEKVHKSSTQITSELPHSVEVPGRYSSTEDIYDVYGTINLLTMLIKRKGTLEGKGLVCDAKVTYKMRSKKRKQARQYITLLRSLLDQLKKDLSAYIDNEAPKEFDKLSSQLFGLDNVNLDIVSKKFYERTNELKENFKYTRRGEWSDKSSDINEINIRIN